MKKTYFAPEIQTISTLLVMPLASSGVRGNGDGPASDINYGGVDEQGTKDPASRRHRNVWEDEDVNEEF